MPIIFRKLRLRNLSPLRLPKYLGYAIGEILLVVIGILIALQVNTWNDERKLRDEEAGLLRGLLSEMQYNQQVIYQDVKQNGSSLRAAQALIELTDTGRLPGQGVLDSLLAVLSGWEILDLRNGATEEIISSGKLGLIRNDSLRFMISSWPGTISSQSENMRLRSNHFYNTLLPALAVAYPIARMDSYMKMGEWYQTNYQRNPIAYKGKDFNAEILLGNELQGLFYIHLQNQDFILMTDETLLKIINTFIALVEKELDLPQSVDPATGAEIFTP